MILKNINRYLYRYLPQYSIYILQYSSFFTYQIIRFETHLKFLHEELVLSAERHDELDEIVPIDLYGGIGAQVPLGYVLAQLWIHPEYGDVNGERGAEGKESGHHIAGLGQVDNAEPVRGHQLHFGCYGRRFRIRAQDRPHSKSQICFWHCLKRNCFIKYGYLFKIRKFTS